MNNYSSCTNTSPPSAVVNIAFTLDKTESTRCSKTDKTSSALSISFNKFWIVRASNDAASGRSEGMDERRWFIMAIRVSCVAASVSSSVVAVTMQVCSMALLRWEMEDCSMALFRWETEDFSSVCSVTISAVFVVLETRLDDDSMLK